MFPESVTETVINLQKALDSEGIDPRNDFPWICLNSQSPFC